MTPNPMENDNPTTQDETTLAEDEATLEFIRLKQRLLRETRRSYNETIRQMSQLNSGMEMRRWEFPKPCFLSNLMQLLSFYEIVPSWSWRENEYMIFGDDEHGCSVQCSVEVSALSPEGCREVAENLRVMSHVLQAYGDNLAAQAALVDLLTDRYKSQPDIPMENDKPAPQDETTLAEDESEPF